jgi:hypothetical protein
VRAAALCFVLVACAGCYSAESPGDGGADGSPFGDAAPLVDPFGDASLALRTRALFAQTCRGGPESGCHSDGAAGFTATLDPDGGDVVLAPATEMPGLFRVEPYHPETSYLYWKVSADPRIDGGTMPLSTGYDPRIPALIGPWIEAGAP